MSQKITQILIENQPCCGVNVYCEIDHVKGHLFSVLPLLPGRKARSPYIHSPSICEGWTQPASEITSCSNQEREKRALIFFPHKRGQYQWAIYISICHEMRNSENITMYAL